MRDQAEPSATIEATDSGPRLVVCYPLALAADWLHGDEVSLKASLEPRGPGSPATLLIEKDFQCLIPRDGEQQGDHFPNPAAKAAAKD